MLLANPASRVLGASNCVWSRVPSPYRRGSSGVRQQHHQKWHLQRDGTPPETRHTLDRLLAAGYPETEARRLIACAVTSEIFNVLTRRQPYDEARYVAALRRLPTLPWE